MSNTCAGIKPSSVPPFIVMQIVGALFAVVLIKYLHPEIDGEDVVVPHDPTEQIA